MINFVSNLPADLCSGGFSAMNAAAYTAIRRLEPTRFVGPINPPAILREKTVSKFRRVAGLKGSFSFFSERRLRTNADAFHSMQDPNARLDFFHGFTPWILTTPEHPYVAWSDCTFHDYVAIFCDKEQFLCSDLHRIEQAEATWLRKARRVLFTSDWAAQRAVSQYGLEPLRVSCVGIFGNIEMPARDEYSGSKDFIFISTNFTAKGGAIVISAFREVRKRHSDARLTVVGDCSKNFVSEPRVTFTGFLRKEVEQERRRFEDIVGHACAVVHPTRSDIAPLLIVEAGYLGCPVIASRRFAIPELVDHGRTGLLIDDPSESHAVARAMCWMLENPREYEQMRQAAWAKARESHSRSEFERRLIDQVYVG